MRTRLAALLAAALAPPADSEIVGGEVSALLDLEQAPAGAITACPTGGLPALGPGALRVAFRG